MLLGILRSTTTLKNPFASFHRLSALPDLLERKFDLAHDLLLGREPNPAQPAKSSSLRVHQVEGLDVCTARPLLELFASCPVEVIRVLNTKSINCNLPMRLIALVNANFLA